MWLKNIQRDSPKAYILAKQGFYLEQGKISGLYQFFDKYNIIMWVEYVELLCDNQLWEIKTNFKYRPNINHFNRLDAIKEGLGVCFKELERKLELGEINYIKERIHKL